MCRVEFPVSHLQSNTWAVTREFGGRLAQRARRAGGGREGGLRKDKKCYKLKAWVESAGICPVF